MKERLQKIIAAAGVASRREAEKIIIQGRVTVNDDAVKQLGAKADIDTDQIRVDGKLILQDASKVYLMLHKPRGYVTTLSDPEGRAVVTDLLSGISERVFPVGRLDYDSEGLLLLTNDGSFSQRVQHPRFKIPKTYTAKIDGHLTGEEFRALKKGVKLNDGSFKPENLQILRTNKKSSWLVLTIAEGRNRLIRRGLESLGHPVLRLIRTSIGEINLGKMKVGTFRHLTKREVQNVL